MSAALFMGGGKAFGQSPDERPAKAAIGNLVDSLRRPQGTADHEHPAYDALLQWGWRADAALIQAARSGSRPQRQRATAILARRAYQTWDRRIVALFVGLSRSEDVETRRLALDGLWAATGWIEGKNSEFRSMNFRSPEALDALLAMSSDPDAQIQAGVFDRLRRLLWSYHPGLDLAHLVKHPQPQVRASALAYVRREGLTRQHLWALTDRDALVRRTGMRSLRGMLNPYHVLALKGMVETGDEALRVRVAEVLAETPKLPEAMALLRVLAKDPSPAVARKARQGLH